MAVVLDLVNNPRPRHPEKAHKPDSPVSPKPDWIRVKAPVSPGYFATQKLMRENGLHTVCEEAGCPNIGECWEKKHATFMIMGDTCTRACAFCNVKTGLPGALDPNEPARVADATAKLGLAHIVVTSVDRDDLADGGAGHFAETIRAIRARCPQTTIEVLTPDFLRKDGALEAVVEARPDVFNHNLETVPSLYLTVGGVVTPRSPTSSEHRHADGDQSGEQIERNRGQLRATRTRSTPLNPLRDNQNLPAGGRAVAGSNPFPNAVAIACGPEGFLPRRGLWRPEGGRTYASHPSAAI